MKQENSEYINTCFELHITKEKGQKHSIQEFRGSEAGLLTAIASMTENLIRYNVTTKELIREAVNKGIKGAKKK